MKDNNHESIFTRNIQRGVEKGYISFSAENSKITYHCSRDYSTSFKKPEEKVRRTATLFPGFQESLEWHAAEQQGEGRTLLSKQYAIH